MGKPEGSGEPQGGAPVGRGEVWAAGDAYEPLQVPTVFRDFDDYWTPFLGGQGPAPGYAMSLEEPRRAALREALPARLPAAADGSIALTARAWAVAGRRPGPVSGR